LRLKDKGFPRLKGKGRGDLYAVIKIRVPKAPKGKAGELIRELDEALDMDPRKGLW
jgi:DnaJ-class molecular chaperone